MFKKYPELLIIKFRGSGVSDCQNFFFIVLVYMPLKYDEIFSYIHCLLCLWWSLRFDVFFWARRFLQWKNWKSQRICIKFCVKNEIKCCKVQKFTRYGSVWLFPIPKVEETHERTAVFLDWRKSLRVLKDISKSEYQGCFENWKKRWHKCIISGGDYFEGDHINVDE